jgi:predicted PolB exonuclease-like 3'-5' exonuclease
VIGLEDICIVMHTLQQVDMNYTKEQLIDALVHEWDYLCHDDYDPEDPTPEEYRKEMEELTIEQLIEETSTDEIYTLDDFMENHG